MNGKNYESVFKNVGEPIDLFLIDDFPGHPYKVIDNSDMTELTESIKANGLLNPIIVRKKADGRYELISGHRRKRAYEILKLKKINAVITDLNDDEAIIMMVDSNYQRSNILPSEKAFLYKMKLDAIKRQGKRTDLTLSQVGKKFNAYEELITKTVDIHIFAQRYDPFGKRNIADVEEYVGIECLRNTDEGALYSVHKVKQGGLLYVFYDNYDWNKNLANKSIIRWFYVRERLSFSDFENLTEGVDTIDDVIKLNGTEQIFLNIYCAYPNFIGEEVLYTTHYLEDGILDVAYKLVDGKLVLSDKQLTETFDCPDLDEAIYHAYNARILDIDWLE